MQTFYSKVQEVRDKMTQMSHGQKQLMRLHEQSKTAVQVDKTRRIREEMANVTEQVLRQAKFVKNDVDYLEKANAEALRKVCPPQFSAQLLCFSV
jgi:t-SNARE complex subunit (syntaxin)